MHTHTEDALNIFLQPLFLYSGETQSLSALTLFEAVALDTAGLRNAVYTSRAKGLTAFYDCITKTKTQKGNWEKQCAAKTSMTYFLYYL